MQLRKEAWKKIQDFDGVWTRDLAITGAMLYQLTYEATRDLKIRGRRRQGNVQKSGMHVQNCCFAN